MFTVIYSSSTLFSRGYTVVRILGVVNSTQLLPACLALSNFGIGKFQASISHNHTGLITTFVVCNSVYIL